MITIRKGGIDDIPAIIDIAQRTWPDAYGNILKRSQIDYMLGIFYAPDFLKADVAERNHIFLIAEDVRPVAFAAIGHNYEDSQATKIFKLYVLPQLHGEGIGKMLIEKAFELAINARNNRILLNVNRENRAIQFYEHLGFERISEVNIDIGNGYFMNDYIMERTLPQQR